MLIGLQVSACLLRHLFITYRHCICTVALYRLSRCRHMRVKCLLSLNRSWICQQTKNFGFADTPNHSTGQLLYALPSCYQYRMVLVCRTVRARGRVSTFGGGLLRKFNPIDGRDVAMRFAAVRSHSHVRDHCSQVRRVCWHLGTAAY